MFPSIAAIRLRPVQWVKLVKREEDSGSNVPVKRAVRHIAIVPKANSVTTALASQAELRCTAVLVPDAPIKPLATTKTVRLVPAQAKLVPQIRTVGRLLAHNKLIAVPKLFRVVCEVVLVRQK